MKHRKKRADQRSSDYCSIKGAGRVESSMVEGVDRKAHCLRRPMACGQRVGARRHNQDGIADFWGGSFCSSQQGGGREGDLELLGYWVLLEQHGAARKVLKSLCLAVSQMGTDYLCILEKVPFRT